MLEQRPPARMNSSVSRMKLARVSCVSAETSLIDQGMSRAKRAERIDAHAAAIILQGAIDALTR